MNARTARPAGHRAPRRRHRLPARAAGRAGVAAVLAVAGLLFVASAQTSQGTDLRSDGGDLVALVREESTRTAVVRDRVTRLRAQVQALTQSSPGPAVADEDAARALAAAVGTAAVTGPGVVVTLDDAPRDQPRPAGAAPDDLVVHQQDVQAVINALWAGGAEAMTIMDQRVIATSAPRCVGNVLILQGRTYSPPYRIAAIGDPVALQAALDASADIAVYRQYVAAFGLGYDVETPGAVAAPAYEGSLVLQHARPAQEVA